MESMITIDTNILIRFMTRDDEQQYQQSLKLFQHNNIFIADTVILETEWVLRFAYKFKAIEICQTFRKVFGLPNIYLTNERLILQQSKHKLGQSKSLKPSLRLTFPPAFCPLPSALCLLLYKLSNGMKMGWILLMLSI